MIYTSLWFPVFSTICVSLRKSKSGWSINSFIISKMLTETNEYTNPLNSFYKGQHLEIFILQFKQYFTYHLNFSVICAKILPFSFLYYII